MPYLNQPVRLASCLNHSVPAGVLDLLNEEHGMSPHCLSQVQQAFQVIKVFGNEEVVASVHEKPLTFDKILRPYNRVTETPGLGLVDPANSGTFHHIIERFQLLCQPIVSLPVKNR